MSPDTIILDAIDQGSESWEQVRIGRFTASEFKLVLGASEHKKVRLLDLDGEPQEWGRAQKQGEVWEQLKAAGFAGLTAGSLNASGLKGLRERGMVEDFIDGSGCAIKPAAARKHIDLLVARKQYTPAELGEFMGNDATDRGAELEKDARWEFESLTGHSLRIVGFCLHPELHLCGCSPDALVSDGGLWENKCPLPQNHLTILRERSMPIDYKAQVHGQMAITGASHVWFMSYCPGLPTYLEKIERNGYTENLLQCLREFEMLYLEQLKEYPAKP